MWLKRTDYDALLTRAVDATARRDELIARIFYLEGRIRGLEAEKEQERHRAEAAIDEMTRVATAHVAPTLPIAQEARQRMDPTSLDDMFEEEDPTAVAVANARIATEGPEAIFEEILRG